MALLRPAAALAGGGISVADDAASLAGLFSLCVLGGTAAFLLLGGPGGPVALALSPFLPALALRSFAGRRARPPASAHESLFLAALGIILLLLALWGLALPHFHYDALLYHLPTAALAWQEKTLFVATAHPQVGSNPVLAELPKVWAYAFSGDDSLAGLQQLPLLGGLSALAFSLAARIGARGSLPALAGFLVLLAPKAFEQATSANVDLLSGYWGAASVILLARRKHAAAAVALLVLAQLKYTTLPPAAAGALFLLWRLGCASPAKAMAWAAAFLLIGGSWEWRNLALHGNPTHPYQILAPEAVARAAAGLAPRWIVPAGAEDPEKWAGYYVNRIGEAASGERGSFQHLLAWADLRHVPYDRFGGRWGPGWLLAAVPGLLLLFLLRRRRHARAPFALALLFYLLTPKAWEARFGFLLLPFGFAAAAWYLGLLRQLRVPRFLPHALGLALALWCAAQIARSHPIPAVVAGAGSGLSLATLDPLREPVAELAQALHRLAPASVLIDYTQGERHYYGMATGLLYPYFSRDWNRRVKIVASTSDRAAALLALETAGPAALLLQPGTLLAGEAARLGYHLVARNEAGEIHARE